MKLGPSTGTKTCPREIESVPAKVRTHSSLVKGFDLLLWFDHLIRSLYLTATLY